LTLITDTDGPLPVFTLEQMWSTVSTVIGSSSIAVDLVHLFTGNT